MMNTTFEILCEEYDCHIDDLQVSVALSTDISIITSCMKKYADQQTEHIQEQLNDCLELLHRATTHLWSGNNMEGQLTMSDIYHHLYNEHPDFMSKYLKDDEVIHPLPVDHIPEQKKEA